MQVQLTHIENIYFKTKKDIERENGRKKEKEKGHEFGTKMKKKKGKELLGRGRERGGEF